MNSAITESRLYGLVDGAQYPESLAPWIEVSPTHAAFLFDGFTEEAARQAGPILFEIHDLKSSWVEQIDVMDSEYPCFSVIRSTSTLYGLATHLRKFLFADIGDEMQVLLRWFDPRALPSILNIAGKRFSAQITKPMIEWRYRDVHGEWLEIPINTLRSETIQDAFKIQLDQAQLDKLEAADEPYILMNELAEIGLIDTTVNYAERYMSFERCYLQAKKWKLRNYIDLRVYCVACFQYGEKFDQHKEIEQAIHSSIRMNYELNDCLERVSSSVWKKINQLKNESNF